MRFRPEVIIALLAFAIRLSIILVVPAGYPGDMRGWMKGADLVINEGIHAAYSTAAFEGTLYPPAFFYPLWLTGQAVRLFGSPQFELETRSLDVIMRLGPIIVDAVVAVLVYRLALCWTRGRAIWAGIVYALNPAVLTAGAWMGMIGDSYYVSAVLLSLLAGLSGHWTLAISFLAVGVLTKPQALAFVPLICFLAFTRMGLRQAANACVAALMTSLLVLLPFLLQGTLSDVTNAVRRMGKAFPFMHINADNLWYLIGGVRGSGGLLPPSDVELFLGLITYRDIGLLAFGLLYLAVLHRLVGRSSPRSIFAVASLLSLGFFVLSTRMHVNYSFPAFAFLSIMSVSKDHRYKLVLTLLTVTSLLNWLMVYEQVQQGLSYSTTFLRLLNSATAVLAFVILAVSVRFTIASEPTDDLFLAQQVARLRWAKWLPLVVGIVLLLGSASLLILGPNVSIPSVPRTFVVFSALAIVAAALIWKRSPSHS